MSTSSFSARTADCRRPLASTSRGTAALLDARVYWALSRAAEVRTWMTVVVVIGRAAPQLLLDWPSELQWPLLHRHVELDEVTAAEGFDGAQRSLSVVAMGRAAMRSPHAPGKNAERLGDPP